MCGIIVIDIIIVIIAIPKPSSKLKAKLGKALLSVDPPAPAQYHYNQGLSSQTRDFTFGIQEICHALGSLS